MDTRMAYTPGRREYFTQHSSLYSPLSHAFVTFDLCVWILTVNLTPITFVSCGKNYTIRNFMQVRNRSYNMHNLSLMFCWSNQ
jgi:hypothetical protein